MLGADTSAEYTITNFKLSTDIKKNWRKKKFRWSRSNNQSCISVLRSGVGCERLILRIIVYPGLLIRGNMVVRKRSTDQYLCKILFGQICTWRFRPSVCSHIYLSIMGTNRLFTEDWEVLASLKTGQEVEYNLLQFSVWCLWDLAVGPEWRKKSEVDLSILS